MGGESGVIAAAVLGVEHQADVQNVGLPEGVGGIGAQQGENVLGSGQLGAGRVDIERIALFVVVCLVAVHRVEGEGGDELHTLAHHIGQGDVVGLVVIRGDGEDAFGIFISEHHTG